MKNASDKWYFTKETNAKGLCYIYAYQTQWDPVTKKSKRSARKYVGRLAADSVVNITAKFRTEFPQYAQGTFYFGLDKTLLDEAAYRRDFPDAPGPKPAETEIDTALWDTRSLLNLAIYKLDGGNSMAAMEDWRASVYLPHGPALKSQHVCERTTAQGRRYWDRDDNAIEAVLRYTGRFAIRTNAEANPFKALSIYRLRGQVEQDFNWVDGNRLRCTDTAY